MALIRSIIHMLWMAITVVPYTLAIVLGSLFGMRVVDGRISSFDTLSPVSNVVTVNLSTGKTNKRADISANTAITLAGIADGGRASVLIRNTGGSAVALTFDTGMILLDRALPTTLPAGKALRVAFEAYGTTLSTVTVGYAVQP